MKRKGCHREVGSEGSVEQTCESMDKKRIQGVSTGRAANLPRSPYPSKDAKRRSDDCARKAAEITPGDLLCVALSLVALEMHVLLTSLLVQAFAPSFPAPPIRFSAFRPRSASLASPTSWDYYAVC